MLILYTTDISKIFRNYNNIRVTVSDDSKEFNSCKIANDITKRVSNLVRQFISFGMLGSKVSLSAIGGDSEGRAN